MISRRSILSLFGAMPFAGKAIAEETANLVGIRGTATSSHLFAPYARNLAEEIMLPETEPDNSVTSETDYYVGMKRFLNKFFIPKFREEQIRRNLVVEKIDVDLASLRSISLSYAYHVQKKRNLKKELSDVRFNIRHEHQSRAFYKKHGFHI